MSAAFAEFHFLRPLWLLLLVPLAALAWRLWRHDPGRGYWQQICDPALIPFVVVAGGGPQRRRSVLPFLIGGLLAVLALAGPTYERAPQPVFRDQAALVLLLDLSTSMRAPDITPSRLERARFKIKDLLVGREIGQTALIVFAVQPFAVTPLTDDVQTIESQLAVLAPELMPSQGSDIPRAIGKGVELLRQAGFQRGDLLLITDGIAAQAVTPAVKALRGGQYRLSVLGVGTLAGSPIPLPDGGYVTDRAGGIVLSKLAAGPLTQLAQRGQGLYQLTTSNGADIEALQTFFADLGRSADASATDRIANQWRELGPWLLLPVLACAALAFRRGALIALLLACHLGFSSSARADWFRTPDQAGQKDFRNERYAEAAREFKHPDWRAASQYRAGRYDEMLATLAHAKTSTELYNKGNALARLGRLEDAIKTYDEALKLEPAHADALHNRDLLSEIINRQHPEDKPEEQQQPPQQNEGGDDAQNQAGEQGEDGQRQADEAGRDSQLKPPAPNDDPAKDQRDAAQRKRERNASSSASPNASTADSEEAPEANAEQAAEARKEAAGDPEKALATEQWLRQIPDDPGGLLRRKFLYQYGRLYDQEPAQEEPW
jgi:Ca-activated chloride channel family protein